MEVSTPRSAQKQIQAPRQKGFRTFCEPEPRLLKKKFAVPADETTSRRVPPDSLPESRSHRFPPFPGTIVAAERLTC